MIKKIAALYMKNACKPPWSSNQKTALNTFENLSKEMKISLEFNFTWCNLCGPDIFPFMIEGIEDLIKVNKRVDKEEVELEKCGKISCWLFEQ